MRRAQLRFAGLVPTSAAALLITLSVSGPVLSQDRAAGPWWPHPIWGATDEACILIDIAGAKGVDVLDHAYEVTAWLVDRQPSMIGSDQWGTEVIPNPDSTKAFPVHQELITKAGILRTWSTTSSSRTM